MTTRSMTKSSPSKRQRSPSPIKKKKSVKVNPQKPSSPQPQLLPSVPLSSVPILPFPLSSEPLQSVPLWSEPLQSEPLWSEPLSTVPLSSEPLWSVPLSSEPIVQRGRMYKPFLFRANPKRTARSKSPGVEHYIRKVDGSALGKLLYMNFIKKIVPSICFIYPELKELFEKVEKEIDPNGNKQKQIIQILQRYLARYGLRYSIEHHQFYTFYLDIIQKCLADESTHRFVILPFSLISESNSHMNMILLDKKNKEAERFETHGSIEEMHYPIDKLDDLLKEWFEKNLGYKYIPPKEFCPRIGVQILVEYPNQSYYDFSGFCATYSFTYALLRLLNPNKDRKIIAEEIFNTLGSIALKNYKSTYGKYPPPYSDPYKFIVEYLYTWVPEILRSGESSIHEINEYFGTNFVLDERTLV